MTLCIPYVPVSKFLGSSGWEQPWFFLFIGNISEPNQLLFQRSLCQLAFKIKLFSIAIIYFVTTASKSDLYKGPFSR